CRNGAKHAVDKTIETRPILPTLHQPAQGDVDGFVEVVGDVDKVWIEWADHAGIHHRAVEPVEQAPRGTHWTKNGKYEYRHQISSSKISPELIISINSTSCQGSKFRV
ncbi:hypothetical protein, partial [Collinsella sp. TF05-9AC]|uniref:hypothetical protein n=1 Tax=Collinsella sp. TF05-9AC TaxID=2292330 RepID=UPI001F3CA2BF